MKPQESKRGVVHKAPRSNSLAGMGDREVAQPMGGLWGTWTSLGQREGFWEQHMTGPSAKRAEGEWDGGGDSAWKQGLWGPQDGPTGSWNGV